MGNAIDKKDLLKVAAFLGMGYYRVKESGEFVEADAIARELFGIPLDEKDLSKHSISKLYIFSAERKQRIENLKKSIGIPMTHTLSIRVKGEYRLLFDQCWCEQESNGMIYIVGLVKNIDDRMMSSKALRTFDEKKRYIFRKQDINKILEANIALFKSIFIQKNIEIEYQIMDDIEVMMSENDIDRVICNLLHNASKYSDNGPRRFVRIIASEIYYENNVKFSISNCGTSIRREEIANIDIFKFGYQGRLAYKMDRDGTGVGLADAKEVVEAYSGKISIISVPRGNETNYPQYKVPYLTPVTIRIPRRKDPNEFDCKFNR
ncbi:MAG: HAMP domain-containing histidine kinase [Acidobacteria bacterium]|jgi:hypothetical protein|nr:HAMP domain-containing histidine kinase [Acidobacteriota bacterium]